MIAEGSARMGRAMCVPRRVVFGLAISALLVTGMFAGQSSISHAAPSSYNVIDRQPGGVTSDVLPTTQIDGVVWDQKIVGDNVYAGGEFANARPAGAAPGQNLTRRANLLSYNLNTGVLNEAFVQDTNAPVNVLAVSPDKSRLYVGGAFTSIGGQTRYRLAAINTADGSLVADFAPSVDASINSIAVTDSAVYVGGVFSRANGQPRQRLAAFDSSNGALLGWAPSASANVKAMVTSPDQRRIIIGGVFTQVNGGNSPGSAALDSTTGTSLPLPFNSIFQTGVANSQSAGVYSLTTDGRNVVATAFDFYGGRPEGMVMFEPNSGDLKWIADCYGDSYDTAIMGGQIYAASHHHDCAPAGAYPQYNPSVHTRADAWTYDARATVKSPTASPKPNYAGHPAPAQINWYPEFEAGNYTGQFQGPWTMESNDKYLVVGGEFPSVNRIKQQGLVRFAVPGVAPSKDAPVAGDAELTPTIKVDGSTATLTWKSSWDRDNLALDYQIVRDDNNRTPIATVKGDSLWWDRPDMTYTDTNMVPGKVYTYWIFAVDADGNRTRSYNATVTAGEDSLADLYMRKVIADSPSHYWRMGGTDSRTEEDLVGGKSLSLGSSLRRGVDGFVDGNAATSFGGGHRDWAAASVTEESPKVFSAEVWINTRTSQGGMILGLGDRNDGSKSRNYDRQIYMTNNGRLGFGLISDRSRVSALSERRYNDGGWHHVVATNSDAGMKLYVDGELVAQDGAGAGATARNGFWKIGSDELKGVASAPRSSSFNGTIDEVAIYSSELDASAIRSHAIAGGLTPANTPPVAVFTETCANGTCSFDATGSTDAESKIANYEWSFGDNTTGAGAKVEHTWNKAGQYPVSLTVTDDLGVKATLTREITVQLANQAPVAKFVTSVDGLKLQVDGTSSTDDSVVERWEWSFGDGATASGAKAEHTYTKAGVYTVELKVFDDSGLSNTAKQEISVLATDSSLDDGMSAILAGDEFDGTRTLWGDATTGGAWSYLQGRSSFSTADGAGKMILKAGMSAQAALLDVHAQDVVVSADVAIDKVTAGGGTNFFLTGRKTTNSDYRAKLRFLTDGSARIGLSRVVNGAETVLRENILPGGYEPGKTIHVQLSISGNGSTTVGVKAWSGDVEPTGFNTSIVDTTPELQVAGGVGVVGYASILATNTPFTITVDNFKGMKPAA